MAAHISPRVMHVGAGRYGVGDVLHPTFQIWRELAKETSAYMAVCRNIELKAIKAELGEIEVRFLPSLLESEGEFLLSQAWVMGLAKRFQPHAIISQSPALGGPAAVASAEATGSGVLIEIHGDHYFRPAATLSRNGLLQAISRHTLPKATRIRVLSEGMRAQLLACYGEDLREKVVVLPPRVDLSRFATRKTNWAINGTPKVLMVGAVTERKGQLRFIKAVQAAGVDIEVWLAGEGPDVPACLQFAEAAGWQSKLRLLGQIDHARLAEVLPQMDAFVMYSNSEGTPRALMEAMAVGLPVITTAVGFCADVVEHGVEGEVLGPYPDDEIGPVLSAILAQRALRESYGRAGMLRVEREFAADAVYARYRRLIREVAAS